MSLSDALTLADAAIPCFPCRVADRKPLTPHGFKDATVDIDTIRRWWRSRPGAIPGVPTGRPSGFWVCDLDTDRETGETTGEDNFAKLGCPWPPYSIRTKRGGWHLPFLWSPGLPGCSTSQAAPKIDVRSEGGYVVAWDPAVLIAAAADKSLPSPPETLLRALVKPLPVRPVGPLPAISCASRWAQAAVAAEMARITAAPVGQRNHTLNRAAFKLGQLAADLDLEAVAAALLQAALMAGLGEREAERTIASGLAGGQLSPRARRA